MMLKRNLPKSINDLRSGCLSPKKFKKCQHVTTDLIMKLTLENELMGHNGCVNCLEWNDTGELLASGSDDTRVIIWDPFNGKVCTNINTGHKGNIFSVKFLAKCDSRKVACGAADCVVKVIDIGKETVVESHECHRGRVKRLAVCEGEPYLLWSASEDGTVRQIDIRQPPCSKSNCQSANVLINLSSYIGTNSEIKCLAINPIRSEQVAIGSNDPYVRLYDRRFLTLKSYLDSVNSTPRRSLANTKRTSNGTFVTAVDSLSPPNISNDVVQYFIPGHIPFSSDSGNKFHHALISTTYVTFSPDGNHLLVNMGSEQVYLYDVNKMRPLTTFQTSLAKYVANCHQDLYCDYSSFRSNKEDILTAAPVMKPSQSSGDLSTEMPLYLNKLKEHGNKMYKKSDFHSAVMSYNTALSSSGEAYSGFYANRAAAYISRSWTGDMYAALQDSLRALQIEYSHIKSHFRIAQCLHHLNMVAEAHDYIKYIEYLFPEQSKKIKQITELQKKITDKISEVLSTEKESSKEKSPNGSHKAKATSVDAIGQVTNLTEILNRHMRTRRFIELKSFSNDECDYRAQSCDYVNRFCGHCNTTTDIKEANFFGLDGQIIMAGSDDGNIFFWDRQTENILRVLRGDTNIVNCLQPHPSMCMLASSGIDNMVRIWTPNYFPNRSSQGNNEDEDPNVSGVTERKIGTEQNRLKAAQSNQERLRVDPFEVALMSLGLSTTLMPQYSDEEGEEEADGSDPGDGDRASSNTGRRRRTRRIRIDNSEYCRTS